MAEREIERPSAWRRGAVAAGVLLALVVATAGVSRRGGVIGAATGSLLRTAEQPVDTANAPTDALSDDAGGIRIEDQIEVRGYSLETAQDCALCGILKLNLHYADFENITLAVRYHTKTDTSGTSALWSKLFEFTPKEIDGEISVSFCRLRPREVYTIDVWAQVGFHGGAGVLMTDLSLKAGTVGYSAIDDGPYATVVKGTPSWTLLYSMTQITEGDSVFDGLIAMDGDGYVVWYHKMPYDDAEKDSQGETGYAIWDWVPSTYDVAIVRDNHAYWDLSPSYLAELYTVSPLGVVQSQYENTCSGGTPANFNQVSHECIVDTFDSSHPVLTFQYKVSTEYGNYSASGLGDMDATLGSAWLDFYGSSEDVRWAGMGLYKWNRESDTTPALIYDLFDHFSPSRTPTNDDPNFTLMQVRCTGMDTYSYAIDYHHGSSIALGLDGESYLISLRNFDAIIAISRSGELIWTLCSTIPSLSNFTFASDADKFYAPHDLTQWSYGATSTRITLVDDGDARPGCDDNDDAHMGCYSRGLELELDFTTMSVAVKWQFEFPALLDNADKVKSQLKAEKEDIFNEVGGSITRLDGTGDYVVSFTAVMDVRDDDDDSADSGYIAQIYEVDQHEQIVAEWRLPALPTWSTAGRYRVVPADTIFGEAPNNPFIPKSALVADDDQSGASKLHS